MTVLAAKLTLFLFPSLLVHAFHHQDETANILKRGDHDDIKNGDNNQILKTPHEGRTIELYLNPYDPITRVAAKVWQHVFATKNKLHKFLPKKTPTTTPGAVTMTTEADCLTTEATSTEKPAPIISAESVTSTSPEPPLVTSTTTTAATTVTTTSSHPVTEGPTTTLPPGQHTEGQHNVSSAVTVEMSSPTPTVVTPTTSKVTTTPVDDVTTTMKAGLCEMQYRVSLFLVMISLIDSKF